MDVIEIKDLVRKYVKENAFNVENGVSDSTMLFKDGYFDSMGFVSLISFLESSCQISTLDSDILEENFESIDAITNYVKTKLG